MQMHVMEKDIRVSLFNQQFISSIPEYGTASKRDTALAISKGLKDIAIMIERQANGVPYKDEEGRIWF